MANGDHTAGDLASLEVLYEEQGRLERALLAPLTQSGYANDWRAFSRWCLANGFPALPATVSTVSLFAVDLLSRNRKTSTVRRLVSGVTHVHRREGYEVGWTEKVDNLLAGARRLRPETLEQVKPLSVDDVRAMAVSLGAAPGARALRDRALIVVGFCSALRSASLVTLQLPDVEFESRGAILHIRQEKNDQEGTGRMIGLPHGRHSETCAVRCLREWLDQRGTVAGAVFCHVRKGAGSALPLTPEHVGIIVKRSMRRAGRDCAGFSSHSLRAGLVTEAGEQNCGELAIAAQTGHRTLAMVRRYFRRRDVFRGNVLSALDL